MSLAMRVINQVPRALVRRLSTSPLHAAIPLDFNNIPAANAAGPSLRYSASLLPLPIALGQPHRGPDQAPHALVEQGLLRMLGDAGWDVSMLPQISADLTATSSPRPNGGGLNAKNCREIGRVCEAISKATFQQALDPDNFVLILGGDHCIPIGTIPGLVAARPSTGVVWVDAHADLNTPSSSGSGNMHGMPLGFLLGLVENPTAYPAFQWFKPCLQPKDMVYIGLRDIDAPEKLAIRRLGIKTFSMHDVDRLGIVKVMEMTNDHLAKHKHLHLSYDIDALDPVHAPSTGTTVRGGLTFREGKYITDDLAASGKLTSMELVEVNPMLSSDLDAKTTIDMALTLIKSAMEKTSPRYA